MEPAERQRMEELQRRKNAREAPGYNEKIRLGRIEDSKKEMAERFARAFDLEILYRVSEEKRGGGLCSCVSRLAALHLGFS